MIDLRNIGNAGLIIQYEDLISMIGFNVAKLYRGKGLSKKLDETDIKDVLLSYINREDEDYVVWLKNEYGIDIPDKDMLYQSFSAMQPNLMYAYKMFATSDENKQSNLYVYSNTYSKIAEESIKSFCIKDVKYIHHNIDEVLNDTPNMTFITGSIESINKCMNDVKAPTCLVICDDFVYTMKDMIDNKKEESFKEKGNILLRYTSVVSAGVI